MGKRYTGQTRTGNQYYPDFDGNGRADLHKINPDTNIGQTFFNICRNKGQGSGMDDPDMQDPHEPELPQCPFHEGTPQLGDDDDANPDPDSKKRALLARAERDFTVPDVNRSIVVHARPYPNLPTYLRRTIQPRGGYNPSHDLYRARGADCLDTDMVLDSADDANENLRDPLPDSWRTRVNPRFNEVQLDHPFDVSAMNLFKPPAYSLYKPNMY